MNFKPVFTSFLSALSLFIFDASAQQTIVPSLTDSRDVISLNGIWKFKYFTSSQLGNDSLFYNPSFSIESWKTIKTPGNWELQGFDEPIYGKKVKEAIGLYRREFIVPKEWKHKPVFICFDGVSFGYAVWVNGKYVGEYASSFNRKIFDISSIVSAGVTNTLAVKVITHPKGWEFDTNDDWSLSGITRDVTLFSLSPTHIEDVIVKTYVSKGSSSIVLDGIIGKAVATSFSPGLKLVGQLVDPFGKIVNSFSIVADENQAETTVINFHKQIEVKNAQLWSAENPNLYQLRVILKDNNTELQQYTERIGIREITWVDGVLKLNGSPIKLRGATHHDLSPINGRSITEAEMVKDLKLMYKANINFLRTSHYPPHPRLLELCDSLGFYVMDEVPYGFGEEHLEDSSYLPILLQRATATIQRDKNHPSIIVWSVGNENPVTNIGLKTGRYVKSLDNTRPYCFPQTPTDFEKMLKSIPDSLDILDDHYAKASDLKRYVTLIDRPLILSEYAHALGLDFNDMESIYETMMTSPKFAGGAVWEFFDQGILRKAKKPVSIGEPTLYVWANKDSIYDTGENQGTDGIVYSNRVPQIDYWQVRKVYSPVKAVDDTLSYRAGKNSFRIKLINRYDFTNLSKINCTWQLFADAKVIGSGKLGLNCIPHDTVSVEVNAVLPQNPTATYYYLTLMFNDKKGYQFYEKTYFIKQENEKSLLNKLIVPGQKPIKVNESIVADNYRFEWEKDAVKIVLKNKHGEVLIADGVYARVGRKATMAQDATTTSRRSKVKHTLWNPFILKPEKTEVSFSNSKDLAVTCSFIPDSLKGSSLTGSITYHFSDSGFINVKYSFVPKGNEEATETGISFLIPSSLSEFWWVGKGPYAAYPGKDRLSEFGIYHLNSSDLYFAGNRQNVGCAIFSDKKGNGFALVSDNANISIERTSQGLLVSHNAYVSGRFNKYEWPEDLFSFKNGKQIDGSFSIVPISSVLPLPLKSLFGNDRQTPMPYQPFYYSYDQ